MKYRLEDGEINGAESTEPKVVQSSSTSQEQTGELDCRHCREFRALNSQQYLQSSSHVFRALTSLQYLQSSSPVCRAWIFYNIWNPVHLFSPDIYSPVHLNAGPWILYDIYCPVHLNAGPEISIISSVQFTCLPGPALSRYLHSSSPESRAQNSLQYLKSSSPVCRALNSLQYLKSSSLVCRALDSLQYLQFSSPGC